MVTELDRTICSVGRPATSPRDISFPPGPPVLDRLVYRFLLVLLARRGLDICLQSTHSSVFFLSWDSFGHFFIPYSFLILFLPSFPEAAMSRPWMGDQSRSSYSSFSFPNIAHTDTHTHRARAKAHNDEKIRKEFRFTKKSAGTSAAEEVIPISYSASS